MNSEQKSPSFKEAPNSSGPLLKDFVNNCIVSDVGEITNT